jgi:ferric-dicitrate binding protein FerR (iron transport regulator)
MKIEVLGTQFNINTYNDEAMIKTTLLEGKVDMEEVMAWMDG